MLIILLLGLLFLIVIWLIWQMITAPYGRETEAGFEKEPKEKP